MGQDLQGVAAGELEMHGVGEGARRRRQLRGGEQRCDGVHRLRRREGEGVEEGG